MPLLSPGRAFFDGRTVRALISKERQRLLSPVVSAAFTPNHRTTARMRQRHLASERAGGNGAEVVPTRSNNVM